MKPNEVLAEYRGKRLVVDRQNNYIKLLYVDRVATLHSTFLPSVPMWFRNQIPFGISCIEVKERPIIVPLSSPEQDLLEYAGRVQRDRKMTKYGSNRFMAMALGLAFIK